MPQEEEEEEGSDEYEDDFEQENRSTSSPSSWKSIDYHQEIEMMAQIGGGGVGLVYRGRYQDRVDVAVKTLVRVSETIISYIESN